MPKGIQAKPLFVPAQKIKRVKLSVEIASDVFDDLKLYTDFLAASGHDAKLDEVTELVLAGIRKDKVFTTWKSNNPRQALKDETVAVEQAQQKRKITGAGASDSSEKNKQITEADSQT